MAKCYQLARPLLMVVGVNGGMARIRTVHPLDFARIKHELSRNKDRDSLKKNKDRQAEMVEVLVSGTCLSWQNQPHATQAVPC